MSVRSADPRRGEFVLLRASEPMWICELELDDTPPMVKVRDDAGFTLRVRADSLRWDTVAGMWGVLPDVEDASSVVNPEGDPTLNGALG